MNSFEVVAFFVASKLRVNGACTDIITGHIIRKRKKTNTNKLGKQQAGLGVYCLTGDKPCFHWSCYLLTPVAARYLLVSLFLCVVCVFVCLCACKQVSICAYMCVCVCVCVCVCGCMHVCVCGACNI